MHIYSRPPRPPVRKPGAGDFDDRTIGSRIY